MDKKAAKKNGWRWTSPVKPGSDEGFISHGMRALQAVQISPEMTSWPGFLLFSSGLRRRWVWGKRKCSVRWRNGKAFQKLKFFLYILMFACILGKKTKTVKTLSLGFIFGKC